VQKDRVERGIGTEILGYRIDAEVGTGGKGVGRAGIGRERR
jgi:hypothetical protein